MQNVALKILYQIIKCQATRTDFVSRKIRFKNNRFANK